MKIYFYAYSYDMQKDGTVDPDKIQAASWDVTAGDNITRAVIIGESEVSVRLYDHDRIVQRQIDSAEAALEKYRAESTAKITAMLAHINELKALEAPK